MDEAEARHFQALADEWWSPRGKFRALHAFNPARLQFIVREIGGAFSSGAGLRSLSGLNILDIGCGGGILAEPLARLGAEVTGIDPVAAAIEAAKAHAAAANLKVNYRAATAEELASEGAMFDAVIASEVIEHVSNVGSFLETCRRLCKPNGAIIVSTLNRTAKSYALAIVAAEKVLGLIPRGTHDWNKFIKPSELAAELKAAGSALGVESGIVFSPLSGEWKLSDKDLSVNYIMSAKAV